MKISKLAVALVMVGALYSADALAAKRVKCPAGTYSAVGASQCTPCEGNSYSKAGASVCINCKDGYVANTDHTACILDCPSNATCPNGVTAFVCNAGYYKKNTTDKTCTACPAGYKCTGNNKATKCGENTYSVAGSSTCTPCENGYSAAGAAKCTACPAHAISCSSATVFTCEDGYYESNANNKHTCKQCEAGYYCKN